MIEHLESETAGKEQCDVGDYERNKKEKQDVAKRQALVEMQSTPAQAWKCGDL